MTTRQRKLLNALGQCGPLPIALLRRMPGGRRKEIDFMELDLAPLLAAGLIEMCDDVCSLKPAQTPGHGDAQADLGGEG
ncbi:MAG: hypothetical protein U0793_34015 [Gemmataceae bacterium]